MPDEEKKSTPTFQTIEEEAGLGPNWAAINSTPVIPGRQNGGPVGAPPMGMTGIDNFQSGQLPPFLGLSPDLVNAGTPGPRIPVTRLMPIAPGGVSQNVASVKSVAQPLIDAAIAAIPPAPKVTDSDGLTHGTLPWESDPGYVILRDNFPAQLTGSSLTGGAVPQSGIGQLGWALFGNTSAIGGPVGGVPPYLSGFSWANNNVASQAGWLTFSGTGGFSNSNHSQLSWELSQVPGSVMTFVFQIDTAAPLSASPTFDMTQKSMYIGLTDPNIAQYINGTISRPNVFIGVRYDTSTTSPSINDSFLTLEVVANPTFNSVGRNNTQGATLVTAIPPVQGAWHRLDIFFNATGSVTLVLDGSSANTLTTPVPTVDVTATVSALVNDNAGRLNWTVSPTVPMSSWNKGTALTVSGFTGGLVFLNGVQTLNASVESFVGFDIINANTSGSGTATLSGYPSLIPVAIFGNDDTSSPSANGALLVVNYFSYVWNPNLGSNAPGTPDATLPRYF